MKGIIIHKGKYSATRQYATWLSEELSLPMVSADELQESLVEQADYLVIGSSVYTGKLLVRDWLQKHIKTLQNKRVFLFVVCSTPASEPEKQQQIIDNNVPADIRSVFDIYFLPGRLIISELTWKHRMMMKMVAGMEKDPAKKQVMTNGIDEVKKVHLAPLLSAVRKLISPARLVATPAH